MLEMSDTIAREVRPPASQTRSGLNRNPRHGPASRGAQFLLHSKHCRCIELLVEADARNVLIHPDDASSDCRLISYSEGYFRAACQAKLVAATLGGKATLGLCKLMNETAQVCR
jgi:hypothetical protein